MISSNLLLLIPIAVAFIVTYMLINGWIPTALKLGMTGKDMNKFSKPEVANLGGFGVLAGILGGLFSYIFINTYIFNQPENTTLIFAAFSTILTIAVIGIIDDIFKLNRIQKPLLTIPATIPMIVAMAGVSTITVPLIGTLNIGILYPLIFVSAAIIGASNGFNMLAGYNGLEGGLGLLMLIGLSYVTYMAGSPWVTMIGLITAVTLFAFLIFNWFPSKVFPGNMFTYVIGTIIAIMAVLGHVEAYGVFIFIPFFMDFLLPLRAKFKTDAWAKVNPDGSLESPYDGIYDVTHLMIIIVKKFKKKVYETDVTISVLIFEGVLILIGIPLFG